MVGHAFLWSSLSSEGAIGCLRGYLDSMLNANVRSLVPDTAKVLLETQSRLATWKLDRLGNQRSATVQCRCLKAGAATASLSIALASACVYWWYLCELQHVALHDVVRTEEVF